MLPMIKVFSCKKRKKMKIKYSHTNSIHNSDFYLHLIFFFHKCFIKLFSLRRDFLNFGIGNSISTRKVK